MSKARHEVNSLNISEASDDNLDEKKLIVEMENSLFSNYLLKSLDLWHPMLLYAALLKLSW